MLKNTLEEEPYLRNTYDSKNKDMNIGKYKDLKELSCKKRGWSRYWNKLI